MSTATVSVTSPSTAFALRRLYFVRFGFAIIWAGLFATTGSSLSLFAGVLLVLYPAFDVLAAAVDSRSSSSEGSAAPGHGLYVNMAISTVAAVGLAIAAADDIAAVLRVWGAWAVVAGLVQLYVAASRRRLGGQGAMIASGGISVLAGSGFTLSASDATTMVNLAGYAVLGGVFFLVSALRLGRRA